MKTHLDEQPLPQGWNLCCSTTSVVFSKLHINTDLLVASATLLVKVDESLHWSITCNGVDVSECTVLDSVPSQLNEVSEMMQLKTSKLGRCSCTATHVPDIGMHSIVIKSHII